MNPYRKDVRIVVIYSPSSSKYRLANVRPIVGPDRIYFVERDVEEQVDHLSTAIFELGWKVHKLDTIYKVAEHDIKLI